MAEVAWYPLLVSNGDASRNALLVKEKNITHNEDFVVCKEASTPAKTRSYARFVSYIHFVGWMFKNLKVGERSCYEVAISGSRVKPFFDIDFTMDPEDKERFSISDVDAAVTEMGKAAAVATGLPEAVALVFSSFGKEDAKYSYHIVIDKVALPTIAEAKQFAFHVKKSLSFSSTPVMPQLLKAIDPGVYKSNQQFRVLGCRKSDKSEGQTKIFRKDLSTLNTYVEELTTMSPSPFVFLYGASLITSISGCKPPLSSSFFAKSQLEENPFRTCFLSPNYTKTLLPTPDCSLDTAEKALAEMTKKFLKLPGVDSVPFKIGGIKGSIVTLIRTAPSFCPICQRTHSNENPYMMVDEDKGVAKFNCRRTSEDNQFETVSFQTAETAPPHSLVPGWLREEDDERLEFDSYKNPDYRNYIVRKHCDSVSSTVSTSPCLSSLLKNKIERKRKTTPVPKEKTAKNKEVKIKKKKNKPTAKSGCTA
jgi:hypothetical protein